MREPKCLPDERGGHRYSMIAYVESIPYQVICSRCARAVGLSREDQMKLRYPGVLQQLAADLDAINPQLD